jgi:hypothetical protein
MKNTLIVGAAFIAAGAIASPAFAQGGGATTPPPGVSLVSKLGSSAIAVNTGQPVVETTLITNNSAAAAPVTLRYQVSTDQLSSSCQMAGWSAPSVLVKPGSTTGVTTKVPAPGCSGTYTLTVVASVNGVDQAKTTDAWAQFLKTRNG